MKVTESENLTTNSNLFDTNQFCSAKGDTGTSIHYWMEKDHKLLKILAEINRPHIQLPNNEVIAVTM